ncbi:MAG: rhodanese-like domain-containing protein [bacterium]
MRRGLTQMTTSQILLYAFLFLIVALYIRRKLQLRGLKVYAPQEVAERMKQSAVLLDVRTAQERDRNSIKHSIHIPLHQIAGRAKELEKYKTREIICYCQSGNRSLSAAARLKKLGFTVANMSGGISAWNSMGLK